MYGAEKSLLRTDVILVMGTLIWLPAAHFISAPTVVQARMMGTLPRASKKLL